MAVVKIFEGYSLVILTKQFVGKHKYCLVAEKHSNRRPGENKKTGRSMGWCERIRVKKNADTNFNASNSNVCPSCITPPPVPHPPPPTSLRQRIIFSSNVSRQYVIIRETFYFGLFQVLLHEKKKKKSRQRWRTWLYPANYGYNEKKKKKNVRGGERTNV